MNDNRTFTLLLESLNEQQREAVESIEGPQMVIAGPGTGKTQVIAARIGNILRKTDAQPNNILCLTYTDAATIAMRKRLIEFIGPTAYNIHIHTFHAFCNSVIQDNLRFFGGYRELQPITELEKVELLEKMIDDLPNDHILKRLTGDTYFEGGRLTALFQIMKKENWRPEHMTARLNQYLKELPLDERFLYKKDYRDKKKGDLKEKDYQREAKKVETLIAACELFDPYNERLREMQRYDFHDMIVWVLDAFQKHPNLLLDYQEQFQYILVDEYQDTNGAQNDLLYTLCDYWEAPNIFVVGDDDQSIYRFQGANMENILAFKNKYKAHLKETVLTANYRSTQTILNASRSLIIRGEERLESTNPKLNKNLTAKGSYPVGPFPKVHSFINSEHEKAAVIQTIEKLNEQNANLDEVAVIYRSHKQATEIIQALEKKGIPIQLKKKVNVLEEYWIHRLLQLCRYLSLEINKPYSGEHLLPEILHYSFFNIHPHDIAKISRYCAYNPDEDIQSKRWMDVLQNDKTLDGLFLKSAHKVKAFVRNINKWQEAYFNETVQVQVDHILTYSGMLSEMLQSRDKMWNMQLLTTLYDLIKEESRRTEFLRMDQLLETIEKMLKYKIDLPVQRILKREKGVHFITAHSSKGLEFEHVIILGANHKIWEGKRPFNPTYSIPQGLFDTSSGNALEDERRLFYVAMTRAKRHLDIFYHEADSKEKNQQESRFVVELLEDEVVETDLMRALTDDEIFQFSVDQILSPGVPEFTWIDRDTARDVLQNFKLSVTALNKYLSCPISFYFDNILRVPSARTVHTGFGNAIHLTLEKMRNEFSEKGSYPNIERIIQIFEQKMAHLHSHFTKKEFEDRLAYGKIILPKYVEEYINEWTGCPEFEMEYNISQAVFEDIPIKGRLDRVEIYGREVDVIDFKTGKVDRGRQKARPPKNDEDPGEDYWRQMVFYKILIDNDPRNSYTWRNGFFDFVQPDRKTDKLYKVEVEVDKEAEERVKSQIKESWYAIHALKFEQGCGEEDCKWCQFTRYNKIVPPDEEEENVEDLELKSDLNL